MSELSSAANQFLSKLRPDDLIISAFFCDYVKLLNKLATVKEIKGMSLKLKSCGSTRLFEAVDFAFKKMRKFSGRKAIVLFSDGEDSGISIKYPAAFVTEKDNYKEAMESDSMFYSIQFGALSQTDCVFAKSRQRCEKYRTEIYQYMKTLPELTGGRHLKIDQIADLAMAFTEIADELKQQYSLGYYPKNKPKPGERREIRVRVKQPGLVVRARDSYIAGKPKSK